MRLIFILTLLLSSRLLAEDLDTDEARRAISDTTGKQIQDTDLSNNAWFKADADNAKIFKTKRAELIVDWMGTPYSEFDKINNGTATSGTLYEVKRVFTNSKGEVIYANAYVPHPSIESQVKGKLEKSTAALEPPTLAVLATKEIEIQGQAAQLYTHSDDKTCSILIHLPHAALINLESSCKIKNKLLAMAKAFTIEKFAKRLAGN